MACLSSGMRLRLSLPADTWRRRSPDLQAIFLSGLFDAAFYRADYPVLEAGIEPILHFLEQGGLQGCDPNPLFDSDWYLEKNPDVAAAGINPLLHYICFGTAERRTAIPASIHPAICRTPLKLRLSAMTRWHSHFVSNK